MAVVKRIKKQDHEKLTSENIKKVISLLEAEKPISKKEACEILNISYNTTRLANIIEDFRSREAYTASRKAINKGKPATKEEIQYAVTEYLAGGKISNIAAQLYRSAGFIKNIIERVGVPQRDGDSLNGVDILPEQCITDHFSKGEVVWSSHYHTTAIVGEELTIEFQSRKKGMAITDYEAKYGCKAYQIYVTESVENESNYFPTVTSGGFFAYALACELGSLRHLESLGISLKRVA